MGHARQVHGGGVLRAGGCRVQSVYEQGPLRGRSAGGRRRQGGDAMNGVMMLAVLLIIPGCSGPATLDKTGTSRCLFWTIEWNCREKMGPANAGPGYTEREGFEPSIAFQLYRFSRPTHSTTLPPLRRSLRHYRSAFSHCEGGRTRSRIGLLGLLLVLERALRPRSPCGIPSSHTGSPSPRSPPSSWPHPTGAWSSGIWWLGSQAVPLPSVGPSTRDGAEVVPLPRTAH